MVTSGRRHPEGASESFRPSLESSDPESSSDSSASDERKTPSASFIGGLVACVVLLIILILAYRHVTKKPSEGAAIASDPLQKNLEQKPQPVIKQSTVTEATTTPTKALGFMTEKMNLTKDLMEALTDHIGVHPNEDKEIRTKLKRSFVV
ncbi:uncharacterized protein LOC144129965 [Amblyomma americanum]